MCTVGSQKSSDGRPVTAERLNEICRELGAPLFKRVLQHLLDPRRNRHLYFTSIHDLGERFDERLQPLPNPGDYYSAETLKNIAAGRWRKQAIGLVNLRKLLNSLELIDIKFSPEAIYRCSNRVCAQSDSDARNRTAQERESGDRRGSEDRREGGGRRESSDRREYSAGSQSGEKGEKGEKGEWGERREGSERGERSDKGYISEKSVGCAQLAALFSQVEGLEAFILEAFHLRRETFTLPEVLTENRVMGPDRLAQCLEDAFRDKEYRQNAIILLILGCEKFLRIEREQGTLKRALKSKVVKVFERAVALFTELCESRVSILETKNPLVEVTSPERSFINVEQHIAAYQNKPVSYTVTPEQKREQRSSEQIEGKLLLDIDSVKHGGDIVKLEETLANNIGAVGAEKHLWGQEYKMGTASLMSALQLCSIDHNRKPYLYGPQNRELAECDSPFITELIKCVDMIDVKDNSEEGGFSYADDFIISAIQRFVLFVNSDD